MSRILTSAGCQPESTPQMARRHGRTCDIACLVVLEDGLSALEAGHVYLVTIFGDLASNREPDTRCVRLAYWTRRERNAARTYERLPLQLTPPHPSLHSHCFPSSLCLRFSPSASESHSAWHNDVSERTEKCRWGPTWCQAVDARPSWGAFTLSIIV